MKKSKSWHEMTLIEKAEECERLAKDYRPGPCLDQVLKQAADLRAMAGRQEAARKELKKLT